MAAYGEIPMAAVRLFISGSKFVGGALVVATGGILIASGSRDPRELLDGIVGFLSSSGKGG